MVVTHNQWLSGKYLAHCAKNVQKALSNVAWQNQQVLFHL
jgi:hypothetical protein